MIDDVASTSDPVGGFAEQSTSTLTNLTMCSHPPDVTPVFRLVDRTTIAHDRLSFPASLAEALRSSAQASQKAARRPVLSMWGVGQ